MNSPQERAREHRREDEIDLKCLERRPRQGPLEHAVKMAALEAGQYLKSNAYRYTGLAWKKRDDPVTDMDRKAELMIRKRFRDGAATLGVRPNIIGEECEDEMINSYTTIYIDPIDGTKSFISGMPAWGTLIGLLKDGAPVYGMMHQPFIGERFSGDGVGFASVVFQLFVVDRFQIFDTRPGLVGMAAAEPDTTQD